MFINEVPEHTYIGNGEGLLIQSFGSSYFSAPNNHYISLALNHLILDPTITRSLTIVSKLAKENFVYFEFHAIHRFVKTFGYSVS